jgi:hypothetical protein
MPKGPIYRTYEQLSEATGIQVGWLRKNLRIRLPANSIRIVPGTEDGEVYLVNFKKWLETARIVKYTQMCLHLGMSKGQANGDIRRIRKHLIPSVGSTYFIQERDAVTLAQEHRESTRGLKGTVNAVRKPSTIKYSEDGKKRRTRATPPKERPTMKPPETPPTSTLEGLRRAGAEAGVVEKGFKPPVILSDDRKPDEIAIRLDLPVPITITVKYGSE